MKELPAPLSININKAGIEILTTLPGIGLKTAEKIIALRDSKGGFKKLDELMEVKGIGAQKFNAIKKYLFIE
ncbi:MAG: helix-hairpin-helix domain-containing protein [Melioribacteraceae bacterium]|nr:MAG: helix-hairpin-helix domain-containing protein [Melioribacteraceae bacterium]